MRSTGRPTLFIVEDNFMYSYLLEATLKEQENFKITTLSSGEECIELLENKPDIIILDYNLDNGMDGFETFKIIHELEPKIPVIVVSSQTDVQLAADILKHGAFDYIEKKNVEVTIGKLHQSVLKALSKN